MGLASYKKKRSFSKTPEPTGGKGLVSDLRFVIQKHAASRLHYDFRLEMEGVLKSWAVPKGPSMNPIDKRLAVAVEDHPYDYRNFEGIIPAGNYGAGTVIVWDEGTYESLEGDTKKNQEKLLLKQLKAGSIKFRLHGTKLKGEFALVKLKGKEDNAWLLIKHRDKYATINDIIKKDKSVLSGNSIEKIAAQKNKADGIKSTFPKIVKPMLASLVDNPPEEKGWLYEIKWDGYRAMALLNKGKVNLLSRNNKSFNKKFYPVAQALEKLKLNAILDGEVAVLNDKGVSNFSSLQNWRSEEDGELIYYVFDITWLDGYDLKSLPLSQRRKILENNLPVTSSIRLSETFETSAQQFLSVASKMGMEGIIAKKADSIYSDGERSTNWLKIKLNKRHEVVIGGFTHNEDSSKPFSSLLVGVYDKGKLNYTGKIGTGFSIRTQKELLAKMKKLVTSTTPFTELPAINKPSRFRPNPPNAKATWIKPQLVCEVSYTEITNDGVMRHPSFEGMRIDKKAEDVIKENELPIKNKKPAKLNGSQLLNASEESQIKKINGHELKFTNLSKIYWPKEKYTKRDMLNYYHEVAPYILPYLKDRPQSLNRYPNGITGKSFYHKDITASAPDWVKQKPYTTEKGEHKNFMVPENEAAILYIANLGAIEMNPWSSTIHKENYPDWCLIDLDPSSKNTFDEVIETALVTKEVIDSLKITGFVKTSGSTGIHIYIPLGAKYTYDQSQLLGKIIATRVNELLPEITSVERMIKKRKGKLYIDYLQNRPKATLAAPYSLRPKPGATVSMPLHWEEVKKGLRMDDFTIKNAIERIKKEGDIFKGVLGKGINLNKLIR